MIVVFVLLFLSIIYVFIINNRKSIGNKNEKNISTTYIEVIVESEVQNLASTWLFIANYKGSKIIVFVSRLCIFDLCKIPNKGQKVNIQILRHNNTFPVYVYYAECQ